MTSLTEIAHTLRRWDLRVENMVPIWPKVGNVIARMNAKAFASRGASTGKPWKPLAPSTIRQKGNAIPLVRSGTMKRQFTSRPMGIERYFAKQAIFGAPGRLPKWQQEGTHLHGKRHIPPRLIQRLNPEDRKKIAEAVSQYIFKGRV